MDWTTRDGPLFQRLPLTVVRITILRHAFAGHKGDFSGPDQGRMLDATGERDAEHLVAALTQQPIARLVSSPATRCIQTLGPLAEAIDLPIELWDGLGPDADSSNLVECFTNQSFSRAVLCTHGEVMSPLLRTAEFRSVVQETGLDGHALLAKGTAWRLHLTPKGKLFGFKHVVPIIPPSPKRSERRVSK